MVLPLQPRCAIAMSPFNSAFLTCATCLGASVLAIALKDSSTLDSMVYGYGSLH
jgi:hypothetical protein